MVDVRTNVDYSSILRLDADTELVKVGDSYYIRIAVAEKLGVLLNWKNALLPEPYIMDLVQVGFELEGEGYTRAARKVAKYTVARNIILGLLFFWI